MFTKTGVYTHVHTYANALRMYMHIKREEDAGTIFGKVKYAHIGKNYYTYFASASVKV